MIHRFSDRESEAYDERPPRTVIGLLFRNRVPILIVLGVLLVAGLAALFILPRQYQSHFDILVRNKLPSSARANASTQETVDEERMQSELNLLHAPELAARVVDPDIPAQPDATHTAADIKRHQAALALFSQQLVTVAEPNSNIIHVTVTAEDPHRAADLADRLLAAFFAAQSEVDHPTAASAFFINEASHAKEKWQEAQLALDGFVLAHPAVPTGASAELSLQIAALKHQIQRNEDQIDATIGRILTGERKLITIPARPLDPGNKSRNRSAAMPPLSASQLSAMLAIYTDEQAILLTRPPTDAEAVRASLTLATQIADTNASLQLARQTTAPEHDPAVNSLWQSTTQDVGQASSELKTLYVTRGNLANQLAGFQTSLDAVQRPGTIVTGLESRASTLQSVFRQADQRANEARIADAMDQQLRLNVAVVSRPSYSNVATSPSPWLFASTIALAVIFIAVGLVFFVGMYSNELDAHEQEEEYGEEEDSSDGHYAHDYVPEPQEETQQQIPFPSRIRKSQSGAFLYAAPGASVPSTAAAPLFTDPLFDPIPSASRVDLFPTSVETTVQPPSEEVIRPKHEVPEVTPEVSVEPDQVEEETYPSPAAEIFHPNQYHPAAHTEAASEDAGQPSEFEAQPNFTRHPTGEHHHAVPSFFAGPPAGTVTAEEDHDHRGEDDREAQSFSAFPHEPEPTTPVVAAPFAAAPFVEMPKPEPVVLQPETMAIPTPAPEPIVTLPDPTPPWSQPSVEAKSAPLPPLSYWASTFEANPVPQPSASAVSESIQEKAAEPPNVEPLNVQPLTPPFEVPSPTATFEPDLPPAVDPTPAPAVVQAVSEHPPSAAVISSAPAPESPRPAPQPAAAPVEPKAVAQTVSSTLRPAQFLTSTTSTFSAPAFRFNPPPAAPSAPPAAPAQAEARPAPVPKKSPPAPLSTPFVEREAAWRIPEYSAALVPEETAPAPEPPSRDPELVLTYASKPIELVPDPVLPPVQQPYKAPAPPAEPRQAAPGLADFPLHRAPAPVVPSVAVPPPPSAPASPRLDSRPPSSDRPQTYEDMVRALVFPEEFAPYVPPARPTAPTPRATATPFIPEPRPVVVPPVPPPPAADDAPPFFYNRKQAPTPTPPPMPEPVFAASPTYENHDAIQSFIRRPSVPLQPPVPQPGPAKYDDRTVYRPAQTQAAGPAAERHSEPFPHPGPNRSVEPTHAPEPRSREIRDDRTTYHPVAATPAPAPQPRSSWIDVAPPPAPRGDSEDPQKRQPDRISAIRDSGSRIYPVTDKSGVRLTPSQRMKRGRTNTNPDDKTRY